MRPRILITMLTLSGLTLASCSSSLQVSKTSSWDDEIYGKSISKSPKVQVAESKQVTPSEKSTQYSKMDAKFAEALKALEDSSKKDTVIYKAEDPNPYRRILSDSYQESYERRLRGFEDPRYGLENWSVYYSDDYRYAQAYDPSYYRIVVMGSNVWVEPWYIYNSFGWPRSRFYFGFGLGFGYNYWNSFYNFWDPWYFDINYYNPWVVSPYYVASYQLANSAYWIGWYDATYYWDKYTPNSNYYGRRNTGNTNNTEQYVGSRNTSLMPSDGQLVTTRRSREVAADNNPVVTTRETQTRVTPTYETRRGEGRTTTGEQVAIRREHTTRTAGEGTEFTPTRTTRPTREIGISEPTRRTTTPTYERPRTGSGNEFNSTRRVERPDNGTTTISRDPSTSTPTRTTTPTYNRPSRVSTPSSTGTDRSSDTYRSSGSERSHSSGSSYSGSRSSSGSSSSSSSSSSGSSSSSSSSSTRTRR